MLSQIESDGDDIFTSIQKEVEENASAFGLDILILLMEKWDREIAEERAQGTLSVEKLLLRYIGLKVSAHHVKKRLERDWVASNDAKTHEIEEQLQNLIQKTKYARRDYYVAKQRIEAEHRTGCDCRGCRCIGRFRA